MNRPALLLVLALVAVPLHAQDFRYNERSRGTMTVSTPQGSMAIRSEHDAVIGLDRHRPDSLEAWYEELSIASISPQGTQRPGTGSVLDQRFTLRVDSDGIVETVTTPDWPSSFEGITDLSFQFSDFFPTGPVTDLEVGQTWTDTLDIQQDRDAISGSTSSVAAYRVDREDTFEDVAVFVLISEALITSTSRAPLEGQPGIWVSMEMSGPEQNTFLIRQSDGVMLRRDRTGTLSGDMTYEGTPIPLTLPVERQYENVIRLLDPAKLDQ